VKSKLANWKASLLSIAGRVQLVKSVITSMLTHTMSVYSWPISLLRSMEKCIKNFIWSGDTAKRKLVTVAWKKVCNSYEGGGLGIRSLVCLNEAFNLKLGWDMLHSNEEWANILRSRAIKRRKPINYHIFSSLWNGIKHELPVITENSTWLIGNGKNVNFWYDNWCGDSLQNTFNLRDTEANNFPQSVSDFITNSHWNIPHDITIRFPALNGHVRQITLPLEDKDDLLIWKHSTSGTLSLKDAYQFKKPQTATLNWASKIWCKDIPPSKSLLVWRLMHDKVPTDEKLMERGCSIPSMCSLCSKHTETSFHLFFECNFAIRLWCWLASVLNLNLQFQSLEDIWTLCDRGWSPQCKIAVTAAIVHIIATIWFYRNQARFQSKSTHWRLAINSIISNVALSGNNTSKASNSFVRDLVILKKFNINIHSPKAPIIKEVIWQPPIANWVKCNTDGASNTTNSSCGGIFRNSDAILLCCFAENIGGGSAYHAEISGVLRAIEIASQRRWLNLWIETDSALVVMAFKNATLIPCNLRNRWDNCKLLLNAMNFIVSHIYREGNQCADRLAALGLTIQNLTIWSEVPLDIREFYVKNRLGMPNFRFINF